MLLHRFAAASILLFLVLPFTTTGSPPLVGAATFSADLVFDSGIGIITRSMIGSGPMLSDAGWEQVFDPTPGSPMVPWFATTISVPGEMKSLDLELCGWTIPQAANLLSIPRPVSAYDPEEPFLPWKAGASYPEDNIRVQPIGYSHSGPSIMKVYSVWVTPTKISADGSSSTASDGRVTMTWEPSSPTTRAGNASDVPGTASISPNVEVVPEYLIVTDEGMGGTMAPLVEWRTGNGIPTSVVTVQDIYAAYPDREAPESIRDYLRDVLDTWGRLRFVMLAGDWDKVPTKYVYDSDMYAGWDDGRIPADSYYSCLDGTWDLDGDGIYGEIGDLEDIIPDIAVSRLAINDPATFAEKIGQIIDYESIGPSENWSSRAVLIAANTHNEGDGSAQSEYLWDKYLDGLYADKVPLYEDQGGLSTAMIDDELQEGAGFVHFLDHGGPTVWCDDYGYGVVYSDWNAQNLDNAHMLPFVSTLACLSNWFDDTSGCPQWFTECIGEAITENVRGGAIGYVGSSRTSVGILGAGTYLPYDNGLQEDMARSLDEGQFVMGAAFTSAKRHYAEVWGGQFANAGNSEVSLCWLEYTLLGEPGVMLWTDAPGTLTVSEAHDDDLDPHFIITVSDASGAPVEGANVTVENLEMGAYATATTGPDGSAELDCTLEWFCDVRLSVRAHNARIHRSTITISDTIPPSCSLTTEPSDPDGDGGWFVTSPTVRIAPDEEGVVLCSMGDAAIELNASNDFTLPLLTEGEVTITYHGRDIALNEGASSTASIKVDLNDPTIEMSMSPASPDGRNGYYVSEPLITLCSYTPDNGSEVHFYYRTGDGPYLEYENPVYIGDGETVLEAFARDEAGRVSGSVGATISVDTRPPTLEAEVSPEGPDGDNGWYSTRPVLTLVNSEAAGQVQYRIGPGDFQLYEGPLTVPEGRNTVWFRAVDLAGNVGETASRSFLVDSTPPTLKMATDPIGPDGENGIFVSRARVVLQVTDQIGATAYYSVDGGDWEVYSHPIEMEEGAHEVSARAVDLAGHQSAISHLELIVDLTPPNITVMYDRSTQNGFFLQRPLVSLVADEDCEVLYSFGDGETVYDGAFLVPIEEGSFTLTYNARDLAGNPGDAGMVVLKVDSRAPRMDPVVVPLSRDRFLLDLHATDDAFQVEFRVLVDGKVLSDWSDDPEREVRAGDGEHVLTIEARDEAGNTERASVRITVERDMTWLWVLLAAGSVVIIAVAAALFLSWRRRGGGRHAEVMVLD